MATAEFSQEDIVEIWDGGSGDMYVDFKCGCWSNSDQDRFHLNNIDCKQEPKHLDSLDMERAERGW
jgi:hypothetical protein